MIYNLRKDEPDVRDKLFDPSEELGSTPIGYINLESQCPPVYNQGSIGSCTANAIAGVIQFHTKTYEPSRLFIYYNERAAQGTVNQDSGSTLRIGMKATKTYGACPETDWIYAEMNLFVKPPPACYKEALPDCIKGYYRIPTGQVAVDLIKAALRLMLPVTMGFLVYESFESPEVAQTGIVPMPGNGDKLLGGHAVVIVGYDDASQRFLVRNSWGVHWGLNGYFDMPYAYIADPALTMDLWVIDRV